jgi:hypothetical protein
MPLLAIGLVRTQSHKRAEAVLAGVDTVRVEQIIQYAAQ